jgi:hypothetical protein
MKNIFNVLKRANILSKTTTETYKIKNRVVIYYVKTIQHTTNCINEYIISGISKIVVEKGCLYPYYRTVTFFDSSDNVMGIFDEVALMYEISSTKITK